MNTKLKKALAAIVMTGLLSLQVNAATATVKADALNVRQQPSTNAPIIGVAYNGQKFDLISNNGAWATINFNSTTAYVSQQYVTIDGSTTSSGSATSKIGYVTATVLNIRSNASLSASVIGQASNGAGLTILETVDSQWYKITYNGVTGYVASQYVSNTRSTGNTTSRSGMRSSEVDNAALIDFAKKYLGTPYVYGGTTPAGFDCSGFVQYVFSNFGVRLSRTTYTQVNEGVAVSKENLKMGDLVFFGSASNVSHVGIYISDGMFIHSSKPGDTVKITSLNGDYYLRNYYTARRVR